MTDSPSHLENQLESSLGSRDDMHCGHSWKWLKPKEQTSMALDHQGLLATKSQALQYIYSQTFIKLVSVEMKNQYIRKMFYSSFKKFRQNHT